MRNTPDAVDVLPEVADHDLLLGPGSLLLLWSFNLILLFRCCLPRFDVAIECALLNLRVPVISIRIRVTKSVGFLCRLGAGITDFQNLVIRKSIVDWVESPVPDDSHLVDAGNITDALPMSPGLSSASVLASGSISSRRSIQNLIIDASRAGEAAISAVSALSTLTPELTATTTLTCRKYLGYFSGKWSSFSIDNSW